MAAGVLARALLPLLGLMLAPGAIASNYPAANSYIDMHPHADAGALAELGFPAPRATLCMGEACPTGSTTVASIPRPMALSSRPSAAACVNASWQHAAMPFDIDGNCISDIFWMNDQTHQFGWWLLYGAAYPNTSITRQISQIISVAPGYWIAATGDFNNDGKADLIWTSNSRDLYLWTSNGSGFDAAYIGTYPAGWTLVGAADIDGDGYDDLIWENTGACQFGYWLMKGRQVVNRTTVNVACGYRIVFVETAFDSPNGTTPAIFWQGQPSQPGVDAVAPIYLWQPQGQTLNAALYGALPLNRTFVAGLTQLETAEDALQALTLSDTVASDTSNTMFWHWGTNMETGGEGYSSLMPGYRIVAAGHFAGYQAFNPQGNNQQIVWANSAGNLDIWTLDTSNPQGDPLIGNWTSHNQFSLPDFPASAGWHVVRPGVQN